MTNSRQSRPERLPTSYARNYIAMASDGIFFEIGAALISMTTVIPAFVDALGGSASLVGLISGLSNGAWLLPQLLVANLVARYDRRKPLIMWAAWLSRPLFFVFAALVMLLAESHAQLLLGLLVATICVFYICDSYVSLPWMDLLSVAIPERRRGRLLGTYQVLGGLGGVIMGTVVNRILAADSRWGFPENYALIFGLASLGFVIAGAALSFVHEPEGCYPKANTPSILETLRRIPGILKEDRAFFRLILVKIIAGFVSMASSFYVLYAVRLGGLDIASTGLLMSAQVAGTIAAGLLISVVQDARGPLYHIRLVCILAIVPPAAALALSMASGQFQAPLSVYMVLFFVLGLAISSFGWPFYNWIIERASAENRPLYIGTINTLSAFTMLAPMVGGLLVDAISYEAVFIAAGSAALLALLLSLSLPTTRPKQPTANEAAE